MAAMVNEIVRYGVDRARVGAFLRACREAANHLLRTQRCLRVELFRADDPPEEFLLMVAWSSLDRGELTESGPLAEFRPSEKLFCAEILETRRYRPVELPFCPAA